MSDYDDGSESYRLRQELREQFSVSESTVERGWATHGIFQLVGNGKITNDYCGRWIAPKFWVCLDSHGYMTLDGGNFKGKAYIEPVQHWCMKPSCSVCFRHGWAVRAAGEIENYLRETSKRFGKIEHFVVSVPPELCGLDLKALRAKVKKVCFSRGIVGGVQIFHGFRYANEEESILKGVPFGWYWSVQFHVLGPILGGYEICRRCKHNPELLDRWDDVCRDCDGFEACTRKLWRKDGFIVKVAKERGLKVSRERQTIFGSAWYMLEHATVDMTKPRFHPYTYFGVTSYRKLKVSPEVRKRWRENRRKRVCPICGHDLVLAKYMGNLSFSELTAHRYKRGFIVDLPSDGLPVWFVEDGG